MSELTTPQGRRRKDSVPESVIIELRQIFEERQLSAGSRLPTEAELASTLGVSRSSVREALQVMRVMGLVDVRHGVGTFLADVTSSRMLEPLAWSAKSGSTLFSSLIEARLLVEVELARLAAINATVSDLEAIDVALRRRGGAAAVSHVVDGIPFHVAIARASKNEVLAFMIGAAGQLYHEILGRLPNGPAAELASFVESQQQGHTAIFAAIVARNPELARAEMEAHLIEGRAFYETQLAEDQAVPESPSAAAVNNERSSRTTSMIFKR